MQKIVPAAFICLPSTLFAHQIFLAPITLLNTNIDAIVISHYLKNEPADQNFNSKFEVLEFWATWCKPRLKAVPHLNKLQEKFKDSDIVFLSLPRKLQVKQQKL